MVCDESQSVEAKLFEALVEKNIDLVKELVLKNPKLDLNCVDKDDLTPLQHACHFGDPSLAELLIDHGADVNLTKRSDGYTPLMFAAISSNTEVVRLLLERGVDTTATNCVNRTAAQMAAFVGQLKVVSIINSWAPYEKTIEPYTKTRELEECPRIPSTQLGKTLYNLTIHSSLHPVKLLLYIRDNLDLVKYSNEFTYVLDNLSSKSIKNPNLDEHVSVKYYYHSYLIQFCRKLLNRKSEAQDNKNEPDWTDCAKEIDLTVRRLIKRDEPDDVKPCTAQLDKFIMECLMKYTYTQTSIFKTMAYAFTRREKGDLTALAILNQTLNGPRMFGQPAEACSICGEMDRNKKCSKCKSIYYCGPICQRADWFQHKRLCKSPDEVPLLDSSKHEEDE